MYEFLIILIISSQKLDSHVSLIWEILSSACNRKKQQQNIFHEDKFNFKLNIKKYMISNDWLIVLHLKILLATKMFTFVLWYHVFRCLFMWKFVKQYEF